MTERRLLSSLATALAPMTLHSLYNGELQLRDPNGKVLFTVSEDDIFDKDGMRFENDLELEQ